MSIVKKTFAWMRRPFPATRACARLGVIAATFCGLALALHVGGRDGYALPMTALLGAPTNMILGRLASLMFRIPSDALWSGADWNVYLLLFSASVAVNWTLIGLASDLASRPPRPDHHSARADELSALTEADIDPLLREFEELERKVRQPDRPIDVATPRRAA